MRVNYYNIGKDFLSVKKNLFKNVNNIGKNGNFIGGSYLKKFEKKIKNLLNPKFIVGVANGSDALELALRYYNFKPNSEVITVSNTFASTVNAIVNSNLKPVFADIDSALNIDPESIQKLINKNTVAIIPVHLNGMPCCMKKINKISKKNNLVVIEDCAQSILTKYNNNYIGNSNNISCFSMHPTKNLGAMGDAGFITTNSKKIYEYLKIAQNHGIKNRGESIIVGRNSRLDEIQASYVLERLKSLRLETKKKQKIAKIYDRFLVNNKFVKTPDYGCCLSLKHTYHRYVIRCKNRNKLIKFLNKRKIETKVHYLKLLHQQLPYKKYLKKNQNLHNSIKFNKEILSLPCTPHMTEKQTLYIINLINFFYKSISKKN